MQIKQIQVWIATTIGVIALCGFAYSGVTYLQEEATSEFLEDLQFQKLVGDFELHKNEAGKTIAELEVNDIIGIAETGITLSLRQAQQLNTLSRKIEEYEKGIVVSKEFIKNIIGTDK